MAQNGGVQLNSGIARYETAGGAANSIPSGATEPTGTSTGVTANFVVDTGGTTTTTGGDHLFANWWWFRVNNVMTRESAVRPATTAVRSLNGTNGVSYDFAQQGAALNMTMSYTVVSTSATSAEVRCVLTVLNTSTAGAVDVSIFNYVDYFLNNADASDFATGATVGSNQIITVTDIARPGISLTHTGFGATGYLVGGFSATSGQVSDANLDNFVGNTIANVGAGGGDIAGVMQWNLGSIGSGQSATVTSIISVAIPTPAAASLLGLGGLLVGRRRR
ncbi:MAG: hypothetical protein ACREJO_08995 [Phycisphaerales bacterium]